MKSTWLANCFEMRAYEFLRAHNHAYTQAQITKALGAAKSCPMTYLERAELGVLTRESAKGRLYSLPAGSPAWSSAFYDRVRAEWHKARMVAATRKQNYTSWKRQKSQHVLAVIQALAALTKAVDKLILLDKQPPQQPRKRRRKRKSSQPNHTVPQCVLAKPRNRIHTEYA